METTSGLGDLRRRGFVAVLFSEHFPFLVALLGQNGNFRVEIRAGRVAEKCMDYRKRQIGFALSQFLRHRFDLRGGNCLLHAGKRTDMENP